MKFSGPFREPDGGPYRQPDDFGDVRGHEAGYPSGFGKFAAGRFGDSPLGCSQLQPAVQNLGVAIQAAQQAGLDTTNADFNAAATFYNTQTSFLGEAWVAYGQQCTNLVTQANSLYTNLNAATLVAGGSPPNLAPTPPPDPSILAAIGLPSWLLPVTFGIIGLGLLAWLVSSGSKIWGRKG